MKVNKKKFAEGERKANERMNQEEKILRGQEELIKERNEEDGE